MNKILTKVTALCVGLAMVAGVGVAVGSKKASEAKAIDDSTYTISETPLTSLSGGEIVAFGPESTLLAKNSADSNWLRCGTFAEASVYEVVKIGTEFFLKTGTSYVYSSAVKKIALDSSNKTAITLGTNGVVECTYGVYAYNANSGNGGIRPYASVGSMSNTYLYELSEGSSATLESIEVTGYMTKTAYTTAQSWDPSGLVVTAHYDDSSSKTVTGSVEWTYSPASPADGVTSVVATASYGGKTASSSAQTVSVTVAHAGTAEDPFTVAEGIAKCKEIGTTAAGPWVVRGIISKKNTWDSKFPNVTYWISDDGLGVDDVTKTIQCFRGKYKEGADVTASNEGEFVVGATVVVTGNLVNYQGNTPEYAANNYPLSITAPVAGDIEVTFEPETSLELGNSGTFSATASVAGATFTYATSDSSIISVNSSTGAYEATGLGTARITVTATKDTQEGSAFADIVVNGNQIYTVSQALELGESLPNGATTDYTIVVEGYVIEFGTSTDSSSNPRALDIADVFNTSEQRMMVYTNVSPYADFINGLQVGSCVRVRANLNKYNSKLQLKNPEKVYTEYIAETLAYDILHETEELCSAYVDGTSSYSEYKAALEAKWETLANDSHWGALTDLQKGHLRDAGGKADGTMLQQALYRYDFLTSKYQLDNFITSRTVPTYGSFVASYENNLDSSSSITIIVIVAVASMTLLGVTLVIRKRKMN